MREAVHRAIALVGVGAVLPDAPDVPTFWSNLKRGRYSIAETPAERWDAGTFAAVRLAVGAEQGAATARCSS